MKNNTYTVKFFKDLIKMQVMELFRLKKEKLKHITQRFFGKAKRPSKTVFIFFHTYPFIYWGVWVGLFNYNILFKNKTSAFLN